MRRVHASEPHDLIMKLLGKKYPDTIEEFEASNLPEPFDHELAGVSRGLLRCACAGYLYLRLTPPPPCVLPQASA